MCGVDPSAPHTAGARSQSRTASNSRGPGATGPPLGDAESVRGERLGERDRGALPGVREERGRRDLRDQRAHRRGERAVVEQVGAEHEVERAARDQRRGLVEVGAERLERPSERAPAALGDALEGIRRDVARHDVGAAQRRDE